MNNDLIIIEAEKALAETKGRNYTIQCGATSNPVTLVRDVDFGVIPKTKKPSLYKSGAEKVAIGYGLLQHYRMESKIEINDPKAPFFMYVMECQLVKIVNGMEYVFTSGYGSSNTMEKRNGFNSAYDSANATLKMAEKRALVAAAISIAGMSDAFSQDQENEDFMAKGQDLLDTDKPDTPISTAQIRRLYAIGGDVGLTATEVKNKLAIMGFLKTKEIKQRNYNAICDALQKGPEAK
jgi:hypothetical protein